MTSVAFSPDGTRIVAGGGEYNKAGEVKVWDAATGKSLLELKGHTSRVYSVAFSPDGTRIVTGGGEFNKAGEVNVWDAGLARPSSRRRGTRAGCIAWRSALTARGSSPAVMTMPPRCGTRGPARPSSS